MNLIYLRHNGCDARMLVSPSNLYHMACPHCHSPFEFSSWIIKSLPCPFVAKRNLACSIVLKPTRGTFLQYKVGDDLHIGISDAYSVVHSYWFDGVYSENSSWNNSIVVCQFITDKDKFHRAVMSFLRLNSNRFLGEFYNDSEWNCFDFVMEFLRFINCRHYTKTDFVDEFVYWTLATGLILETMADALEDTSSVDTDRIIDRQNFACSQFEIFTHEYRERKEIPNCGDHGESESSCFRPSSSNDDKKRIVNASRKLQKAVYSLQCMPGSEAISEMINKMKEIANRLSQFLKQREAEFSTTNVPLPQFDASDMQLLLGESEVPASQSSFDEVLKSEHSALEQQDLLLFEADVMLREYDQLKSRLRHGDQL